jgi:predicted phosphodiesterase
MTLMRIGLVSDIHGNLAALEAVARDIHRVGVDEVICLGDVLGYGPYPNECVDLVRARAWRCVAGNHDLAVVGRLLPSNFHPDALAAVEWQRSVLTEDNRDWVLAFESHYIGDEFHAMHGLPPRPMAFEYLVDLHRASMMRDEVDVLPPTTFIGHSHLTKCFTIAPHRVTEVTAPRVVRRSDAALIATVGSVGQPRDRDPNAAWVLYEPRTQTLSYRRVRYPVRRTANAIRARGLPRALADRLFHGL